jgi:hypothetical protein
LCEGFPLDSQNPLADLKKEDKIVLLSEEVPMARVSLPVNGLQYQFRTQICDHCAHRTPINGPNHARACQTTCGQYHAVPDLFAVASRLDPMIANVSAALKDHMPTRGANLTWPARRREKVIGLIRRYLNI